MWRDFELFTYMTLFENNMNKMFQINDEMMYKTHETMLLFSVLD